jgi:outer membrane receptor protein involved in Fe transport
VTASEVTDKGCPDWQGGEQSMQGKCLLAAVALLLTAALATAQETTTGSIAGRVVDAQGLAVPGATVTVITPQGTRTFTTDANGAFFAPFLTPGMYEVKVELQGFHTLDRQNIDVRLGQRVELTLPLQVGPLNEAVNVTGAAPVVDTSSTTTGAVLDSEMLQRIPVGRRFSDTLYIAPGVSSGGQVGQANPSMSGGSGLENQYVVDGVNITNAGYGALGSYSIVFGSLGNGVPFDFIKETQVKTGGYEAEFGQSTGGVVNVITKSGTNTLRGSGFGYFRPEGLETSYNQVTTVNGTVNVTHTRSNDAGAEVGGPVVPSKVFFFGAVDPQWQRTSFIAPEGFPLRSLGDVAQDRRIVAYAAKGTWQMAAGHHLDASFFGDPAMGDNGPQRYTALLGTDTSAFSKLDKYGGHNQTVRYEGAITPTWLLEGSFARAKNSIVEIPSVNLPSITDNTVTPQVRSGGIGFFEVGNSGVNWQYQAKGTNVIGRHSVRYGVEYENIDYTNTINRTGPTFTLVDGTQTATGAQIEIDPDPTFGRIFRVVRANTSNVRDTHQHYVNAFAQDTWKVGNRLTINPGIRYERQALTGTLADLTLGNNWAPRVGATFDPTGKGTMKVYGNWGFYYSKIPNDLAARALSSDAGVSRADYFDAGLTQPVPDGVLALGTTSHFLQQGLTADLIDPSVKSSYVNEAVVGFEIEARPGLNVGARYIHRDIPRVLEDVQPFPIVAGDLGIPGATTVDYTLTNPGPNTPTAGNLGASFEKAIHRYNAIEVTADKRFAGRWALQTSYRYSRLRGTFEGFFRDDNGQSDPGITSLFDFPTNDPSYTAIGVPQFGYRGDVRFLGALGEGPLPLDRPHQLKIFGNYQFPIALNVGAGVVASSGKPLTALAAHPVYGNGGEIPEGPRGSGFETVDGFRTRTRPEFTTAVHADYRLKIHGAQRVVVLADVFNLFNQQRALDYDPDTQTSFPVLNPDFGDPSRASLSQLQTPRQIRLGVRYEF